MGLGGFVALVAIALLATAPGRVVADTKSYLYFDPQRLLSHATSLWDPQVGAGTVTHQTIGYLWPMGPWFWVFEQLGSPDWVAQRLWLTGIIAAAALGTAFLLRTLGWRGLPVVVASVAYGLSPYVVSIAARLSVILLPFAGLPWMIALIIRAARGGGWRHPALFALVVVSVGSVNATALVLVGVAPVLWLFMAAVMREISVRRAVEVAAKCGVLILLSSAWWAAGLWVQATNGIDILRYTETAQVVAAVSTAQEVLRGLGYWYFYGGDRIGPWVEPSVPYQERLPLLAVTYLVPILAFAAAVRTRWRQRSFFIALLALGVVLSVGAHPWGEAPPLGRAIQAYLESPRGLAMRSLPRAVPLIALPLAVCLGAAVATLGRTPRRAWGGAIGLVVLAAAAVPAIWLQDMVPANLDRPEDLPAYWDEMAQHLDDEGSSTRVLELPGIDFANYRWGVTVDPVTPGLMDRPYLARELVPYGSPASAALLNAIDGRLQIRTLDADALAPLARLFRAGTIATRNDLEFERFNTPRPRQLWQLFEEAAGLEAPTSFGDPRPNNPSELAPMQDELALQTDPNLPDPPPVSAFPVDDPVAIAASHVGAVPLIVAGDADGLVDLAEAGLLEGNELIQFGTDLITRPDQLDAALEQGAVLVVTDTNRRAAQRWGSIRHTRGYTERAGEELLVEDPTDNRLDVFPGSTDDARSVSIATGDLWTTASSYGNSIDYNPSERPMGAVDGDPTTAWRTAAFGSSRGETLVVHLRDARTVDSIRLLQPHNDADNRRITRVRVTPDGGEPIDVDLDEASLHAPGQAVELPPTRTDEISIEILEDSAGTRTRYAGLTTVGFAEVGIDDLVGGEVTRVPVDLLDAVGDRPGNALAILLTRLRNDPTDEAYPDAEARLARQVDLPIARSFAVDGDVRLSSAAPGPLIDALVGRQGPVVDASATIPGGRQATPSMALDGDPTTAWQTPFGVPTTDPWIRVRADQPFTVDELHLQVRNDLRHSLPTELNLEADGVDLGPVTVPGIPQGSGPDSTVEVVVPLDQPVRARELKVTITDVFELTTVSWNSGDDIRLPIAIAELGLGDLTVGPPADALSTDCRSDLLAVDGAPVPARVLGTTADALAGRPLQLELCPPSLDLPAGTSLIETATGTDIGLHVDQLVLRSAKDGTAEAETGPLVSSPAPEAATVTSSSSSAIDLEVPRDPDDPTWLVLGQSLNAGWSAVADGVDLGPPVLLDGFANGWLLPPGAHPAKVELRFEPQRRVDVALALSALGVVLCLVLAIRRPPRPATSDAPARFDRAALRATRLGAVRIVAIAAAAAGVGLFMLPLGWAVGLGLAVAGALVVRLRPGVLAPAILALAALWVLGLQARYGIIAGFEWALETSRVHPVAMAAVIVLVLDVLTARWWQPSSDLEESR
jgi:arabinofuranan 3-O-arabinosyltransferase